MIEIKNLTKRYDNNKVAVDGITLEIEDGKIYGFLGPNGAGKSTTMNMITGCISATDGDVYIDGVNMFDEPRKAKKGVGYLPENPPLYQDMKVYEYLDFVAEIKGIKKKNRKEAIKEVIEKTNLKNESDTIIGHLSKGYKQRVGLAQALLGNPKIIILDEPTVGLDPKQVLEFRKIIKEEGKNHTILLSSHIMQEISAVCDNIIVINNGKIVAQDEKESFITSKPENIELTVGGKKQVIVDYLKSVKGIVKFALKESSQENTYDIQVKVAKDKDIRSEIAAGLVERKCDIYKIYSPANTLEEIYIRITSPNNTKEEE